MGMNNGTSLHTFKTREMFLTFNVGILKMPMSVCKKYTSDTDRRKFAIRFFKRALEMVIDDIIDNGTQFQFPNSPRGKSYLMMQRLTGRRYEVLRKRGAFADFDPIDTDFSAYRIEYYAEKPNDVIFSVPVHLDQKRSKRIAKLAAEHKLKAGKVKSYQDYYDALQKMYPDVPFYDIYRILRFGFNSFKLHMSYGGDIRISNKRFYLQTGTILRNEMKMLIYVLDKMKIKTRVMYRRLHYLWNGYSYFSLSKDRYEAIKDDYNQGKVVDYGEVMLHKCYDEAVENAVWGVALFKVKAGDEKTRFANLEHLVTDKAELIETYTIWDWETISPRNRKYITILPTSISVQKIYNANRQPYIDWLRAKRWKELRK